MNISESSKILKHDATIEIDGYGTTIISPTEAADNGDLNGATEDESTIFDDFFVVFAGVMQVLFVAGYWIGTDYSTDATVASHLNDSFIYYLGVVVMMLIGFGYLMTFLKRAGLSAVGFTFIITMLAVQTDIFSEGFFRCWYTGEWQTVKLELGTFINGNFAAAACLISFGAIIGKAGMQCIGPLVVLETIFYAFNKQIILAAIGLEDIGGTVEIHMFGAYFGLAASFVLGIPEVKAEEDDSNRNSDVFSLIGTTFLWIFWPTFNGASAPPNSLMQERIILNTIISLTACCTWSFVATRCFFKKKFSTVDIQNATLAGGVMIGVVSNYMIHPAGAAIIGMIGATISVVGYNVIMPNFTQHYVHDTCGVNNLHGMPSIGGAIASIILAAAIGRDAYTPEDYKLIFPKQESQWSAQLLGSVATFAMAITSGALSMMLCKRALQHKNNAAFRDLNYWAVDYRDYAE